jgi:glutaminyl-peptide cyclotransferase
MIQRITAFLLVSIILTACGDNDSSTDAPDDQPSNSSVPTPINLSFQIANELPHDTSAFTEGFTFYQGKLYESTGSPDSPSNSGSWIGEVDLKTGKVTKKVDLGRSYFGEGIAFFNDKVYQLTWQTKKGFIYDAKTFKKIREFSYGSEGWGMTHDGQHLIMSTGSSNLYYLSPDSLSFIKQLAIQDNNGYVGSINELEYINGFIYANQWLTSNILKIDPATGYVVGRFDLSAQLAQVKAKYSGSEEMNGIAYDSATQKTYITGKKWPVIYEIKW